VETDKLIKQAARCRRMATDSTDQRSITSLREMAGKCEALLAVAWMDRSPDHRMRSASMGAAPACRMRSDAAVAVYSLGGAPPSRM
jgi:hypothetical protein